MIERALHYGGQQEIDMDERLKSHAPLVKKIGLHLKGRLPASIELDDLIQVGMIGLVNAIGNYDASQGAAFETYASIRIKGAMLDEVRRHGWSPRSLQQKSKQVSDAIHHLEMLHGREARDAEIARMLDIDIEEYHAMSQDLAASQLLSLDEQEDGGAFEPASTAAQPADELQGSEVRQALVAAIESLPEKEKLMMSLYYNEGLNLREIGAVLGVSESRVSQIHGQALARTRARMKDWIA